MSDYFEIEKLQKSNDEINAALNEKGSYAIEYNFNGRTESEFNNWLNDVFLSGLISNLGDYTIDSYNRFLIYLVVRDVNDRNVNSYFYIVTPMLSSSSAISTNLLDNLAKTINSDFSDYIKLDSNNNPIDAYFQIYQLD